MKIFYITPRVPYPIDKGDKLRAYYQLMHLAKSHEIYLFSLDENCSYNAETNPLKDYCKEILVLPLSRINIAQNLISGITKDIPFQTAYYFSNKVQKILLNKIDQFKPDVILCQLIRSAEFAREIRGIPRVIDYVDVISKGLERRIKKSNLLMKVILKIELSRALKYEKKVFEDFDSSIIITEEDQNFLPFNEKEKVNIVRNGIELNYFSPIQSEKKYDLFFSGNLSYPPNIDAAEFIANEIVPIVKKQKGDLKVLIAGASPHKRVQALQSNTIDIKGWTDDIRDYYKISRVFLAPMRIGTGLQNKILQALAMKIPCITSSLTKKGITKDESVNILIGNSAREYADLALKLLGDHKFSLSIAENGYEFVKGNYSWLSVINELELLLDNLIMNQN